MIGPGSRLAHYEVVSAIGKGGMGEVWRAKDTKLGRDVAIKTLPTEFSQDADRLARFEREAKLLASLNHPNIAAIYGLEEHDGSRFLVLELVEGDTLGDRIKRGAIPVEESLRLALQIADALKAAHESGVIHRDLKPDNIKVSDEGNVKVLDFGLAKAMAADETNAAVSNSPTLSMAATQAGMILGTAAYMSPEQAKGRAVDRRADVWAFGCVLYEMLSGRQSFGASDVTESLAAVISLPPKWDSLPLDLHPRLRETVERCLEKQVAKRYQDIGDVKVDIETILADPAGLIVQPVADVARAAPQSKMPWVAAIALASVVAAVASWNLKPSDPAPVSRWEHLIAGGLLTVSRPGLDFSPDGSRFVYNGPSGLNLRRIDEFESSIIPGTEEGLTNPTFSPDGDWLTYWAISDRQLKKIPVAGGVPVPVTNVEANPLGISWDVDATILFQGPEGIMQVNADGGEPEILVPSLEGEVIGYPQLLPGGNAVLFQSQSPDPQVAVASLGSEVRKPLFLGNRPRYVSTGHLVYSQDGALFAVPFDAESLEVTGGPVSLVQQLLPGTPSQYSISDTGSLAYLPGDVGAQQGTLVWISRDGSLVEPITNAPLEFPRYPRVSPSGRQVALTTGPNNQGDLWLYDLEGRPPTPLTYEDHNLYPVWSPDGTQIAFSSGRTGTRNVFLMPADGSTDRVPGRGVRAVPGRL